MKKLLIVFLVLGLVLFSGCQDNRTDTNETITDEYDQFSLPNAILVTLEDLNFIKIASNTMSQDEFTTYMISNYSGEYINGMHSIENTKIILKEFEESTIPVLDGNTDKISDLHLYRDYNCIHQLIIYDREETQRSSDWIYTVNSEKSEVLEFEEEVEIVSYKTIETDCYTANLYETKNADYEFYGEITIDGSYIVLRSDGMDGIEEFEECFSRLEFRKIGDLMNELSQETPETEITEENITVQEEVSLTESTVPEQTEAVITE